jgi:hypothetical protein
MVEHSDGAGTAADSLGRTHHPVPVAGACSQASAHAAYAHTYDNIIPISTVRLTIDRRIVGRYIVVTEVVKLLLLLLLLLALLGASSGRIHGMDV